MGIALGISPYFVIKRVDFLFFLLQLIEGHHHIVMAETNEKNDDDLVDEDSQGGQEQLVLSPVDAVVFELGDFVAVNETKETGNHFSVDEQLDEDDFGMWGDLAADGFVEGDEGDHERGYGGDSFAERIFLEEDTEVYDGQTPEGQKNHHQ